MLNGNGNGNGKRPYLEPKSTKSPTPFDERCAEADATLAECVTEYELRKEEMFKAKMRAIGKLNADARDGRVKSYQTQDAWAAVQDRYAPERKAWQDAGERLREARVRANALGLARSRWRAAANIEYHDNSRPVPANGGESSE